MEEEPLGNPLALGEPLMLALRVTLAEGDTLGEREEVAHLELVREVVTVVVALGQMLPLRLPLRVRVGLLERHPEEDLVGVWRLEEERVGVEEWEGEGEPVPVPEEGVMQARVGEGETQEEGD